MIEYLKLPKETIKQMVEHAEKEFPNESCGYVFHQSYIPCVNSSTEPENSFVISNGEFDKRYLEGQVQYIVHSHNNKDNASSLDQIKQNELEIPSIILNVRDGRFSELFYLGVRVPIIGRPFHFGCWDCLQLVYDYYRMKFKIKLPNPPRDIEFINNNHKFFEEYMGELKQFEVVELDNLQEDDILFYMHAGRIIHVGIYIDNERCLHHWLNRRSSYFPLSYKQELLKFGMRLKRND